MNIIRFSTIDSTNEYLKRNYEHLCHETICISKTQTQGKGRFNRIWHDDGSSCLFSILLKDSIDKEKMVLYPLVVAYTLHKILTHYEIDLSIKWPNDLYHRHKKIAGILLESIMTTQEVCAVIIGIGINTNTKQFQKEIKNQATSLFLETNKIIDHDVLIQKIHECLNQSMVILEKDFSQIIEYINKFHYLKGEKITYIEQGKTYQATALNILENGALEVLRDEKRYQLMSGEVVLIKE